VLPRSELGTVLLFEHVKDLAAQKSRAPTGKASNTVASAKWCCICSDFFLALADICLQSVYCSPACQSAAWKAHKKECGADEQREQSLISQDILLERSERLKALAMKHYDAFVDMGTSAIASMSIGHN
jgi:hypothetical protein